MYKHRVKIFLAIVVVGMAGLLLRLGHLQLVRGQEYLRDAERYLRRPDLLPAVRGRILDRRGEILAINQPCYDLCLDYRFLTAEQRWISIAERQAAKDAGESLPRGARWISAEQRRLHKQLGGSWELAEAEFRTRWEYTWELVRQAAAGQDVDLDQAVASLVARIERMSRGGRRDIAELYQSHAVIEGFDEQQADPLRGELEKTIGLEIRPSQRRYYPRGASACHIIGLTGQVNLAEMERLNRPTGEPDWLTWRRDSYHGGDVIGKRGVELMCEDVLRGRRGYRVWRAGELVAEEPARPGRDVHLTLDIRLQEAIARAFRARQGNATGAAVVVDVPTGEVLALVSVPGFDLNQYRRVDYYRQISTDWVNVPLRHRAVAQVCAPGSTAKPVAALAALGAGRITPHTPFDCVSGRFPGHPAAPKCWIAARGGEHGSLDLIEGLRYSCNAYFDHVGDVLGPRLLTEWYRRFGFGQLPGTGLPDEVTGVVLTDEIMQRKLKRNMTAGDAWQMAIGQGTFSASSLQVANAMATVARGGVFLSPLLSLEGAPERQRWDLPLSDADVAAVHEGMRQVVHRRDGTAHRHLAAAGLDDLGFEICGKTGTAQVPPQRIDSDGDGRADTVVRTGDNAWFAGFAPADDPQVAFAVLVEYAGSGGEEAGPIALDVVKLCRDFGYIGGQR